MAFCPRLTGARLLALLALLVASRAHAAPSLDLSRVPWSHAGSYLTLAHLEATDSRPAGLYLRSVRGGTDHQSLLVVEPTQNGRPIAATESADTLVVRLTAGAGRVELTFDGADAVRVRATGGLGVRLRAIYLRPGDGAFPLRDGRWVFNVASDNLKLGVAALRGSLSGRSGAHDVAGQPQAVSNGVAFELAPDGASGELEASIDEFRSTWAPAPRKPWAQLVQARERELRSWRQGLPSVPDSFAATGEVASFLLWSNRVAPAWLLPRTATFSTKSVLIGDWGWDHCFHALPLAERNPKAAWDELMVVLDAQDPFGALPDRLNDTVRTFDFTKPPVHGWALRWMLRQNAFFRDPKRLQEVYGPLARWTEWWFANRDSDGDGVPEYQNGNDSGWDNATPFLLGVPLESPDLSAFLIVQMDVLADLARRLGRTASARSWTARADRLLAQLLSQQWRGDHFVATLAGSDRTTDAPSLLLWLPIILGDRLPSDVRSALVRGIADRFVTDHGVATEDPRSAHYESDGYWRGPVWGPSTLIVADGLRACGAHELALRVARGYAASLQGSFMPENFDARTGAPRKDTGFGWTAAAYLLLAHDLN